MNDNESNLTMVNHDETTLLIEDFKDTSNKLEATDHKVQFFIQIYIAFLTALISGIALYVVNFSSISSNNAITTGYSDIFLPSRICNTQMQRICSTKPVKGLELFRTTAIDDSGKVIWLPEKYYAQAMNSKTWYLQTEPNKRDRKLMYSFFLHTRYTFVTDYRYIVFAILLVFFTLLTKFLLNYVYKAEKVHAAYIKKLNIIRYLVYESDAVISFENEMFIYDKSEQYKKAGMTNEIVWLLKMVFRLLLLTMIGFLITLILHRLGTFNLQLTNSASYLLMGLLFYILITLYHRELKDRAINALKLLALMKQAKYTSL